MKILLIEDEHDLGQSIVNLFSREGYHTDWVKNYAGAADHLEDRAYDCVLVDLSLPDGNGIHLVQQLKKTGSDAGIIIITARNSVSDRVNGLDTGADDYLPKPFHLAELNSRIKALMRRRKYAGLRVLEVDNMQIFPDNFTVTINQAPVEFTRKEFDLLLFLASNRNRVLTRDSIAEHIWGDFNDASYSYDFLYSQIKNIRKKILDHGGRDYIQSVYGIGYRFSESPQ